MSNTPTVINQPARLALREWMRGRNVTTNGMAADLKFSPVYISNIRTGRRNISNSFKWRFIARYGADAASQVFGDLPNSPQPGTIHAN